MSSEKETPRIYVADVAASTSGRRRGMWIDVDTDPGEVRGEIAALLTTSPIRAAVEWAVRDHSGFGEIEIGEHDSIEKITTIAGLLADYPADLIAALVTTWGLRPIEDLRCGVDAANEGSSGAREQYPDVLASEMALAQIPERLRRCLAFGRLFQHAEQAGQLRTIEAPVGVHVIVDDH